jgi:hypothetical protein
LIRGAWLLLQTAACKLQTRGPWPRLNLNLFPFLNREAAARTELAPVDTPEPAFYHRGVTSLQAIRDKVRRRRYEFSRHAVDQSMLRGIRVMEMTEDR